MRKPAFCICKNKDADQLRGNRKADQRLCFRYTDPSTFLIRNFKPLAIFSGCTTRFVSDVVGNPEDRFSQNDAQLRSTLHLVCFFWKRYLTIYYIVINVGKLLILTRPKAFTLTGIKFLPFRSSVQMTK